MPVTYRLLFHRHSESHTSRKVAQELKVSHFPVRLPEYRNAKSDLRLPHFHSLDQASSHRTEINGLPHPWQCVFESEEDHAISA